MMHLIGDGLCLTNKMHFFLIEKKSCSKLLQLFMCSFFNIYINLILIYKLKFNNISSLRTSSAFNYFEFNFLTFV